MINNQDFPDFIIRELFINLITIPQPMSANSSEIRLPQRQKFIGGFRTIRIINWTSVGIVFIVGLIETAGWIFNLSFIRDTGADWEPMREISSICFLASAFVLAFIQVRSRVSSSSISAIIPAGFVFLVSSVSLFAYCYSFFTGHESEITKVPFLNIFLTPDHRMAFLTSCNFMLLGSIFLLILRPEGKAHEVAHFMIIPVFLISYFTIVSYILGVSQETELSSTQVSLNSGICFLCICSAVVFALPDTWFIRIFTSADIVGIISRRLLPPLILLPILIGWLRIHGERTGLFNSEQGVAIVAVTYTLCFIILVWFTARYVNKIDLKRQASEETLRQSEERFKAIAEASPVGMGVVSVNSGNFLYLNPSYEEFFGYDKGELLSKRAPDIYINKEDRDKILGILKAKNSVSNYQVELIKRDGSSFWSMSSVRRIQFMNEPAYLGTFIDITKRIEAEEALQTSKQHLQALIENSPIAVIEWDKNFIITQWSVEAERIFGWKKAEVLGVRIDKLNLIFEEDIPIVENTMKRLSGGKELKIVSENRNYSRWGDIKNCIWYNSVMLDDKEQMVSVMSLIQDVTEIRRVENLLIQSEEKVWSVLNATQESVFVFDAEGRITMANSTARKRLNNVKENEVLGHHFSEFMPESLAKKRREKLDEIFNYGKPIEFEDERDGKMFNHNFFPIFKDGKVTEVVTYSTDITERKKYEDNLRENEDRFRTIAKSLPVLIAIYRTKDSILEFANESFEKAFGYNIGELTNKKLPESFFNPQDPGDLGFLLEKKGRVDNIEIRVKKSDGTPFWIMTSARKIQLKSEDAYLTASIDITETKKAQEELIRFNRTLNAHNKSSLAMMHFSNEINYLHEVCKIIIEDCGHSMVWIGYARNDDKKSVEPVAYYGFDKGYIEQMNVTWSDTELGRGPTGTAIRTGKPAVCKNMLTDEAFKPWRKAALERGYASSLVLPLISEGNPFGAISIYSKESDSFSDNEINLLYNLANDLSYGISYLRLMESERAAANQIKENEAKLQELIATKDKFFNILAHDLKNPFTSLLGSSELLIENMENLDSKSIHELATILNDSAKSGYAILQNLLDWSRSQTGLLKIYQENINIRTLVSENISVLRLPAANKAVSISNNVNKDVFVVTDKNMINTVLRNLLSNALKFTYKSGKITVTVDETDSEVIVSVTDNGIGIPPDKIDTLFGIEVKRSVPGTENEQGTGLGLSLSKEFVKKLGGKIWVESKEGKGSTFKFTIPMKN